MSAGDWDLGAYFREFGGAEFEEYRDALRAGVEALAARVARLAELAPDVHDAWVEALIELEALDSRAGHLGSYLGCLSAADAREDAIKAAVATAARDRVELQKIHLGVRAALGRTTAACVEALVADPRLAPVRYFIERERDHAARSMPADLEALASELGVDGLGAWGRLYDTLSGGLEFELVRGNGERERLPVAMTRTLLEDPDPEVRRATLRGANAAWAGVGEVAAAALNAIAGARLTLDRRRGVEDFLEAPLFDSGIGRRTLHVMREVVQARFEVPRAFLRRKARLLGKDRLGFHDLMAPTPFDSPERIPIARARTQVIDAFERGYPGLADFAREAFARRWIDHTPRAGKRPGGFCSTSHEIGESRIFMTYDGAPGDVSTLAHELGHAWHGWLMRDMRSWARRYPMTLAETASTFAENLVTDAVLSDPEASRAARLAVLDARLMDAAAYLLNIEMRFRFEARFYEARADGEVPLEELKRFMSEAQCEVYADALDPEELDPWFWASKLHFYITGLRFYNFPYTFGYLFSSVLFARARAEGPDFIPEYETLLRRTGSGSAEQIAAACLGVDLTQPDFWNASLDLVEADRALFEALLAEAGR